MRPFEVCRLRPFVVPMGLLGSAVRVIPAWWAERGGNRLVDRAGRDGRDLDTVGSRDEAGRGPAEELDDAALREEIELLAEVMAAAAEAPQPLCQAEVDRALHVNDPPAS